MNMRSIESLVSSKIMKYIGQTLLNNKYAWFHSATILGDQKFTGNL